MLGYCTSTLIQTNDFMVTVGKWQQLTDLPSRANVAILHLHIVVTRLLLTTSTITSRTRRLAMSRPRAVNRLYTSTFVLCECPCSLVWHVRDRSRTVELLIFEAKKRGMCSQRLALSSRRCIANHRNRRISVVDGRLAYSDLDFHFDFFVSKYRRETPAIKCHGKAYNKLRLSANFRSCYKSGPIDGRR